MPYQANTARRHQFPKAKYQVKNWGEYDQALQQRGSLTVWVTPEAIAAWQAPPTGRRGRSPHYSDLAIETGHLLRLAFGRPWRQTEGLLRSIATLLGVGIEIPDHTTFSRRSAGLSLATAWKQTAEPVPVVIDSTGLKVYGAGEWHVERNCQDWCHSIESGKSAGILSDLHAAHDLSPLPIPPDLARHQDNGSRLQDISLPCLPPQVQ